MDAFRIAASQEFTEALNKGIVPAPIMRKLKAHSIHVTPTAASLTEGKTWVIAAHPQALLVEFLPQDNAADPTSFDVSTLKLCRKGVKKRFFGTARFLPPSTQSLYEGIDIALVRGDVSCSEVRVLRAIDDAYWAILAPCVGYDSATAQHLRRHAARYWEWHSRIVRNANMALWAFLSIPLILLYVWMIVYIYSTGLYTSNNRASPLTVPSWMSTWQWLYCGGPLMYILLMAALFYTFALLRSMVTRLVYKVGKRSYLESLCAVASFFILLDLHVGNALGIVEECTGDKSQLQTKLGNRRLLQKRWAVLEQSVRELAGVYSDPDPIAQAVVTERFAPLLCYLHQCEAETAAPQHDTGSRLLAQMQVLSPVMVWGNYGDAPDFVQSQTAVPETKPVARSGWPRWLEIGLRAAVIIVPLVLGVYVLQASTNSFWGLEKVTVLILLGGWVLTALDSFLHLGFVPNAMKVATDIRGINK